MVQFQPTGRGSRKAGFVLSWYGGLGGADQGSWKGVGTPATPVTHVQSHNNRAGGGKSSSALRGSETLPAYTLFQAWCHVLREQRSGCIPAASRGQGQEGLGIRFNSSQWVILAQRGAWGRGAVMNKVSEKLTRARGGGASWGVPGLL